MTKLSTTLVFAASLLATACVRNPYETTNRSYRQQAKLLAQQLQAQPTLAGDSLPPTPYWVGTTNFNLRKPNYVIIHHTAQHSADQTLKTFTLTKTQVSAHYVIGRDGQTYHMLNDYLRAWHGGVARWGNVTDINSVSVGIELDNDGSEPFQPAQIASLLKVLGGLKRTYNIPAANFIGHSDIAPVRKNDPSALFPWQQLAVRGYGLWYDAAVLSDTTAAPFAADSLGQPLPGLTPREALRIIGYDVQDFPAAIVAFKRHFIQTDVSPILTEQDRRILYNLYRKFL
ncbi:N-acetylmuramoyl-L-alanine amidase [Hymenobacter sp. UV11]|uniref:N-acetylmuramoyl-L-alanine amidase n=1 Tax=Hymenobacter sp. UV11 TaxID=1849735 RepID=UPI00105F8C24|nr:N-acetylmuramoyl-L-alanine amidase [Hymenobacter sp. UV11]TDN35793.1 N-acetylmuramoyl-L-alanine amidase [Hymenobacter sp. UV11]TFZ67400.1 N-acetylmuramoyl-L-alanine amidase [Hymenobacter sp. UV11]